MSVLGLAILVASLSQGTDSHRSCGTVGAPPAATMAEFSKLEEVWNRAYLRNNATQLETLWAERITLIFDGKSVAKQEVLAAVVSRRFTYTRYATSEVKLQLQYGIPSITGKLNTSLVRDGRTVDQSWYFRKVYERGPFGCWQVALYEAIESDE